MDFAFSPEQEALRRSARQFLTECSSPARVRQAMRSPEGFDREVWRRIGGELGWPALLVPEEHGGAGGTHVDLAAIMEEAGRALLCAPMLSAACLATSVLSLAGTDEQKRRHLPAMAAGERLAAVASLERGDAGEPGVVRTVARPDRQGFVLSGEKTYVLDGHAAEVLLVLARIEEDPDDRPSLFEIPAGSPGLRAARLTTMDETRSLASVSLDNVRVPAEALVGERGAGSAIVRAASNRAAIALAAEQVGGAERCLEMALDYAKTRIQFNRPIGSFQAIKHRCADMLVLVESARSAAHYAAWAADEAPSEVATAASIAHAYCSEAYFRCAAENIQIHGGIGFTWEHDAHLHFKRARAGMALFGAAALHRERIAREVLDA